MTQGPGADRRRGDLLEAIFARAGSVLALLPIFLGYVVATVLAVAVVLAFFAHPTGDDFCNAVDVRNHGVFGAVWNEYLHWGGRWSAHLLAVGFPAVFDLDRWYPLPLLGILIFELGALRFLLTSVLPLDDDRRLGWSLAFLLFALHWVGMPHPGQTVYWLEGAYIYSLNLSLGLLLFGCLVRLPPEPGRGRALAIASLSLLALLVSAFHELYGLVLLGVLVAGAGVAWRWGDPRRRAWIAVAAAAGVGVASVLLAPGNEARQETYERGQSVARMLKSVLLMWFRVIDTPTRLDPVGSYVPLGWVVDARLLAATVVFAATPRIGRLRPGWVARDPVLWKLGAPILLVLMLTGSFAGGGWALGRTLPFRAFNGLYLLFLLGWFVTVFVYTRSEEDTRWSGHPSTELLRTLSLMVLALGLIFSTNFKHAVRDLGRGSPAAFHQEMQHRAQRAESLRAQGVGHMDVEPVEPWPSSYFQNDVEDISDGLKECVAEYYRLESVRSVRTGS